MLDDVPPPKRASRVTMGIPGLDEVLQGGIPQDTLFLVQGAPGTGKTTLALQFLMEGAGAGEPCLLVSNAETPDDLGSIASSHGWDLDGISMARWQEQSPGQTESGGSDYTLFPAAEVEVGESLAHLFAEIERVKPRRLVIDSISGLRVLAREPAFYRRQLDRLFDFLSTRPCTTIVVDDDLAEGLDVRTQTLAHGFVQLERVAFPFGGERRRLSVRKLRGAAYMGGYHDFAIEKGGLVVYPRLIAAGHDRALRRDPIMSGIERLDLLAGGGLPCGSSTLFLGPSGSGKSTLISVYLYSAARRGETAALYLFDESPSSYLDRSRGLGMDLAPHVEAGRIRMTSIDPAELTPGQIAHDVVRQVEQENAQLVVLDTLNGYIHGAVQEQGLFLHLRELLSYLSRRGVVTLLSLTQHGILGAEMSTPIDLSFLADNVFLLRFFEARGSIHQAVSLVKRRTGAHERSIRELRMEPGRVTLGEPLSAFSGVLGGAPIYHGSDPSLEGR